MGRTFCGAASDLTLGRSRGLLLDEATDGFAMDLCDGGKGSTKSSSFMSRTFCGVDLALGRSRRLLLDGATDDFAVDLWDGCKGGKSSSFTDCTFCGADLALGRSYERGIQLDWETCDPALGLDLQAGKSGKFPTFLIDRAEFALLRLGSSPKGTCQTSGNLSPSCWGEDTGAPTPCGMRMENCDVTCLVATEGV